MACGGRKPLFLLRRAGLAALLIVLAAGCLDRRGDPQTSFVQYVAGLTNEQALARLDLPSARLVSSYDRTGGNDDFNNPLRKGPKGWDVIADLKGPGCLTRFWTTGETGGQHRVRFYFDGERTPRFDVPVEDLCGGKAPFLSPLAAYEPWCWYSLVPMPYRKRLVIMMQEGHLPPEKGGPKIYYQIGFCPLAKATTVESLSPKFSRDVLDALERTRETWQRWHISRAPLVGARVLTNVITLVSGRACRLDPIQGPGMICDLSVTPDFSGIESASAKESVMRNVILRVFWDSASTASVEVPLGDFFGSVWQRRRFFSACFGMDGDTLYSRFPMPFKSAAIIEFRNDGDVPVSLTVCASIRPLPSDGEWGYFHATWSKTGPYQVGQPHPILRAEGRGRYVGCILSVTSLDKSFWLLEGDESMRVDGESIPSWQGTGLEDYFNGGWYYGNPLVRPFHGLLLRTQFRTIQYRVHAVDPVAFQRSIEVQFERGPQQASHGWMESVGFYYLDIPRAANSTMGDRAFRAPPVDPVAQATIMSECDGFERLGDFRGAADNISLFLDRYQQFPFAPVLRLRQLGYVAREQGFEKVRPQVEDLVASTSNSLARQYGEAWLWYESSPSNALLGLYCNTRARAYLDGKSLGTAGDPERMQLFRVQMTPGRHALAIEAANRPYPWLVYACLRKYDGDVCTSSVWKYAVGPTGQWAAVDYNDTDWKTIGGIDQCKGPPEEPFVWFEPHPFVGMQSQGKTVWVPGGWPDMTRKAVYRTAFETPRETRID